jgi:hypothetical protein
MEQNEVMYKNPQQLEHEKAMTEQARQQQRLEVIRLAQQTLLENARSRPAGEREITAADIEDFAKSLLSLMAS